MLNHLKEFCTRRVPAAALSMMIAVLAVAVLVSQSACFFLRKSKVETTSVSSVRLVLLPFNVPATDKDLRWAALAAPILMAKAGEHVEGIELVPFWQSMPTALNLAGTSRTFTPESAANIAAWLSAKWSVLGELTPEKNGVSMVVDFIPSRSALIPFRYSKTGRLDFVGAGFNDAYSQFLRYLTAKPLEPSRGKEETMTSIKDLAEAFDREYGWFVEAQPGKAQEAIARLAGSDDTLARSLFSPALYPSLAQKK